MRPTHSCSAVVLSVACALGAAAETRPNTSVVLYVLDTLRADRLGLYGYDLPTSPRLDRLAAYGRVFEHAYAPGSSTALSVPALLASRYPVEMNGRLDPEPAATVLPEAFRAAGYATAALQANFGLLKELGYGRGFDAYLPLRHRRGRTWAYWNAREVNELAIAWLSSLPPDRPFFLFVQVMDAHVPYAPPPRYRGSIHPLDLLTIPERRTFLENLVATHDLTDAQRHFFGAKLEHVAPERYDEAIAWVTDEFVRFMGKLRRLGRNDEPIVLLTADHGEPLGDHGAFLHGTNLYEEQVRVPLVLWGPGIPPGRDDRIASLIDVAPTLLDLTGLEVPPSFLGTSLAREDVPAADRIAIGELAPEPALGSAGARYARAGRWKLIVDATGTRLYDLVADPTETRDVSARHPDVAERLRLELARRIPRSDRAEDGTPSTTLPAEVRRELRDALRALGYADDP